MEKLAYNSGLRGFHRYCKNKLILLIQLIKSQLTTLTLLPRDLQIEILSHIDLSDFKTICAINKQFNQLSKNENLWQKLVIRDFLDVQPINNNWLMTYIYYEQSDFIEIMRPYFDIFKNYETFFNIMIPTFIYYMVFNTHQAETYRSQLPKGLAYDETASVLSDEQLRSINPATLPNPSVLYSLDFDGKLFRSADEIECGVIDGIMSCAKHQNLDAEDIDDLASLIEDYIDCTPLENFLNAPIPGIHYLTIVNPSRLASDPRRLWSDIGLNIFKTGEPFTYKINKYYISLVDILVGIKSVTLSNLDDDYSFNPHVKFNSKCQVLTI